MVGDSPVVFLEDDPRIQDDPWELPPHFILRHKSGSKKQRSLRTPSGYWKEKEGEFIGIRSRDESSSSGSPSYEAVRKTFEFYLKDGTRGGEGTKTDWTLHEYHHLRKADDGSALLLEEDLVLRKAFKKGETDLGAQCHPDGKSDNVWKHFTKIRTDDPDVVYAVCHHCDRRYSSGTSHLWRHNKSCASKLPGTGNTNDATTKWEEEIWPLFLVLKNYGETEYQASGMC